MKKAIYLYHLSNIYAEVFEMYIFQTLLYIPLPWERVKEEYMSRVLLTCFQFKN